VDAEGSVTTADGSFVQYPNGLRMEISSVSLDEAMGQADATVDPSHPDYTEGLHVTVHFVNNGTDTYTLNKEMGGITVGLTFGANRYAASGWMSADTLPGQLVPGSDATNTYDFTVPPASAEDNLRLTVTPDAAVFTTYTFTDVQSLIS
jgi:hypothetical protein